ncbi:hypothetical protein PVAND_010415 [Polypedilum vanderplanki]|uniref:Uncharacterized protein n=1 Tax=Polypedilum vanderplanki TaxID=319348 RepID=A0A9J6CGM6_POLVA|nr:hypothetical protein PVAND_010415 [Polypedilum vanderplanki]
MFGFFLAHFWNNNAAYNFTLIGWLAAGWLAHGWLTAGSRLSNEISKTTIARDFRLFVIRSEDNVILIVFLLLKITPKFSIAPLQEISAKKMATTTAPFIELDGFGFLDDSDECNDIQKLSPDTLQLKKQQPPISPIESESSSGISSLDSDDLKKQLLSSPPTISISNDEEEEEEEEEVDRVLNNGNEEKEQTDSGADGDDEELESNESGDGDNDENEKNDKQKVENQDSECQHDIKDSMTSAVNKNPQSSPTLNNSPKCNDVPILPTKVMFHNRDILNLSINTGNSGRFIQYTILPENNISCFFQNRAQYWRLGNGDEKEMPDAMIKCSCCDFTFPSINNNQLGQQGNVTGKNKNPITDSLLTFLKNHHADYNNFNASPNSINANNNVSCAQNNIINANNGMKRMYNNNNNNTPYIAYQMMQQQQQYTSNGFYANGMNGWNNHVPPQAQQQMNNGYNGTALAILNLMNPPRNSASAYQAMNNNTSRYYNNMNTNNNGFGLYKQF